MILTKQTTTQTACIETYTITANLQAHSYWTPMDVWTVTKAAILRLFQKVFDHISCTMYTTIICSALWRTRFANVGHLWRHTSVTFWSTFWPSPGHVRGDLRTSYFFYFFISLYRKTSKKFLSTNSNLSMIWRHASQFVPGLHRGAHACRSDT
jgi:hypothetical protein